MKAILEFDLNDEWDSDRYRIHCRAENMSSAMWDFGSYIFSLYDEEYATGISLEDEKLSKYGVVEAIWNRWQESCSERGLSCYGE